MEESESRAFAGSVAANVAGKKPKDVILLSSGHGPMADLVIKDINLLERILPKTHPNLPVVYSVAREAVPYILMEYLVPLSFQADLAGVPGSLVHEIAEILPSILLARKSTTLISELSRKKTLSGIPSCLSYGYLNLRNLGRRADDTLVIFDWDGACIAPLGSDFKLFRGHAAFPEAMGLFRNHCSKRGVDLPEIDTWRRRLISAWEEEDEQFRTGCR